MPSPMQRLRETLYPYRHGLRWLRPLFQRSLQLLPGDDHFAVFRMRSLRWVNLLTRDPDEVVVSRLSGSEMKMALNLSDELQAEIYYSGAYQSKVLHQVAQWLSPERAFVDVGANVGFFTVWVAGWLSKRSPALRPSVFAFEPDPDLFASLQKNIALNGLESCVAANALAVSDQKATMSFYRSAHTNSGNGSLATLDRGRLHFQTGETLSVEATTLDDYFASLLDQPIGLMKLDIEGAELLALRGARRLLERQQPVLILEACPTWMKSFHYTFADLRAFLERYAYAIHLIEQKGTRPCPARYDLPDGSYDLLCLPV